LKNIYIIALLTFPYKKILDTNINNEEKRWKAFAFPALLIKIALKNALLSKFIIQF